MIVLVAVCLHTCLAGYGARASTAASPEVMALPRLASHVLTLQLWPAPRGMDMVLSNQTSTGTSHVLHLTLSPVPLILEPALGH